MRHSYEYEDYFKILPQINNWDQDSDRMQIRDART